MAADDSLSPAATIFVEWCSLNGSDVVRVRELEKLCQEYPEHADEFRRLGERWVQLPGLLRHIVGGTKPALSRRLVERFGAEADVGISLDEGSGDPGSDALLRRLADHAPTVQRYTLEGKLFEGGMGAILQVYDEDLRRRLAMKVILGAGRIEGDTDPPDPWLVARFLEEAQVTGQLDHPGIVPVHELGLDDAGRVYFTMKLVKGHDLKTIFDRVFAGEEGWNETRAIGVLLKACEAVSFAHEKGVVHRDLKPANVMVGAFGEVYVMDWGLAKVLGHTRPARAEASPSAVSSLKTERRETSENSADSPIVTQEGDVVGTPSYMPPEQAMGKVDEIGPAADVYAMGAMLYHLLGRQVPYVPPGAKVSNRTVLASVLQGPPPPLRSLRTDQPGELEAICEKAMARRIESRYPTMTALADDLRAFLEGRVVRAYETGAWAETRKWMGRNRPLALALVGVFVALLGGLLVSLRLMDEARERTEDVLRLSALQDLDRLLDQERELWPAHPDREPEMRAWLGRAEALREDLPLHRAKLAELKADLGLESSAPEFRLEERQAQWWAEQLGCLIAGIEALGDEAGGLLSPDGISREHGWGVPRRLAEALRLREAFAAGGEHARAWEQALPSLDLAYPGLALRPQIGLAPLREDPESGLWEFWVVMSGARPEPLAPDEGGYVLEEDMGIVLVLLPGGDFDMGSPPDEPGRRPGPDEDLERLHRVRLQPFFLSKYETTQAQWLRVMGSNPSGFFPGNPSYTFQFDHLHPVERVDWWAGVELGRRLGLQLPTESQWEYAARGGASAAFNLGDDFTSLEWVENVGDLSVAPFVPPGTPLSPWDDGFPWTAPVGSFAPNAFGLHDTNGNVAEWCDGTLEVYPESSERPTDGRLFDSTPDKDRVWRGAFWLNHPRAFRLASRWTDKPGGTNQSRGVRLARRLDD